MRKLSLAALLFKRNISRDGRPVRAENPRTRALRLESLESRELLSATETFYAAPPADSVAAVEAVDFGAIDLSNAVSSGTWLVSSTGDDGTVEGTLRYALANAADGDTITFDASLQGATITVGSELTTGKTLTIDASNLWNASTGTPGITVSGGDATRILSVTEGANLKIDGVAFTNGKRPDADGAEGCGGAIYSVGATLSLTNCSIRDSSAQNGGALYSQNSETTLENCSITNNNAHLQGGGVYGTDSTTTLRNCVVQGNDAYYGGGVSLYRDSAVISDCKIVDNSTLVWGGGLYVSGSTAMIANSEICNNRSDGNGGGVHLTHTSTAYLSNCVVANNSSKVNGGGLYNGGALNLYNVTITRNSATGDGGGVYDDRDVRYDVHVYNTIIADNAAASGADFFKVAAAGAVDAYNTLSGYTEWTSGANNMTYDASKPLFTNAESGDFTLPFLSQAVDKGANEYVTSNVDVKGNARVDAGIVDLGAYELQYGGDASGPTIFVTSASDVVDANDGVVTLREALADAESGTRIAFRSFLQGSTITLDTARGELTTGKTLKIDASGLADAATGTPGITISGSDATRILNVTEGANVEIVGIAFERGKTSDDGGAINSSGATLALTNCVFRNSEAGYSGGAINVSNTTATIANCVIDGNRGYRAGGVGVRDDSVATFTGCVFVNNTGNNGGAVYGVRSTATFENCEIRNNTGTREGGGVCMLNSTTSTFVNCSVTNNVAADGDGGGLYLGGTTKLYNLTVAGNRASRDGGGVHFYGDSFEAYNTIIVENAASSKPDFFDNSFDGEIVAYNTLSSYTEWKSGANNLTYDASKPLFTDAASGDYSLPFVSQAVDQGANEYVTKSVDVKGNPRIVAEKVDLGAYEFQYDGMTIVTSAADVVDADDGVVTLREAFAAAESGTKIVFATGLKGSTITLGSEITTSKTLTIDASKQWDASTGTPGITVSGGGATRILNLAQGANLGVVGVVFEKGQAPNHEDGGAIYSSGATLSLTNCAVRDNCGSFGGALRCDNTAATFENCVFDGNSATGSGGAMYFDKNSSATFADCTITNNRAAYGAGGVGAYSTTTTFVNCVVTNNTAANGEGGGLYLAGDSNLYNVTVAGNDAIGYCGGLYSYGNSNIVVNVYNSIIAGNTSGSTWEDGPDVHFNESTVVASAYNTLSSYTLWNTSVDNPKYDASRPLFTNAAAGDYTLSYASQAIDVGANAYVRGDSDLKGNPRIVAETVDLGAYEFQYADMTVVTSTADVVDADDGVVTFREAVAAAESGATIGFLKRLQGSTITLDPALGAITTDKTLTIDASNLWNAETEAPGLMINAGDASRILYVTAGGNVEIKSVGFEKGTAGKAYFGGAIYGLDATLSLTDCTFRDSHADYGGAVGVRNGVANLVNCFFTNNTSKTEAGGFWSMDSTSTLERCVFDGNQCDYSGGGVGISGGSATLRNCTVVNNTANGNGGGIHNDHGETRIENCEIRDNRARYYGGGFSSTSGTTDTFVNCVVTNNTVGEHGGGLALGGNTNFYNVTVARNTSETTAGGVYRSGHLITVNVYNTIIAENDAPSKPEIDVYYPSTINAYNTLSSYTEWTESHDCPAYDASKPLFTDSAAGDFTLALTSQAVDVGVNEHVKGDVDLKGNQRVYAGIVDLGAYELHYAGDITEPTIFVSSAADVVDADDGVTTLREALNDAESGATIMFRPYLKGSTITLDPALGAITTDKTLKIDASYLTDAATGTPGITVNAGDASRILNVTAGGNVSIVGLGFEKGTAGKSYFGGAIYCLDATLSLTDCTFRDSHADYGGAVGVRHGVANLVNCFFTNNTSKTEAGGFWSMNSTSTLERCVFDGNLCGYSGGGVGISGGSATLRNCTVVNNTANGNGGGIHNYNGETWIGNCEIRGNRARYHGGGFASSSGTTDKFVNCAITNNTVEEHGGGLSLGGNADFYNVTVAGNKAGITAGGVYRSGHRIIVNLYNSIVAENDAPSKSEIDVYYSSTINAYYTLSSYTEWTESHSCPVYDASKPLFTDSAAGDFTLPLTSQAVDRGQKYYGTLEVDLNGNERVVGGTVDLGAYELQYDPEPSRWSTFVTSASDVVDANDGVTTLREALDAAQSGMRIAFSPSILGSTITLDASLGELTTFKNITIDASYLVDPETGAPGITVSGGDATRILHVESGGNVVIKGLAFEKGKVSERADGGAIYSRNATLSLTGCVFRDCKADYGGALGATSGTTTVVNCSFTNNSADTEGGAFMNRDATTRFENCVFDGNQSRDGGAAALYYGDVTFVDSAVTNNTATHDGGGIFNENGWTTFENSEIRGNRAQRYGGGYRSSYNTVIKFVNCAVTDNTVDEYGGGLSFGGQAHLYNVTIAGNTAGKIGGGVYDYGTMVSIFDSYNSIIAENAAPSGSDYYQSSELRSPKAYNTLSSFKEWAEGENNLAYDASKPLFTNATSGDYTLAPYSQAIDKGNDEYVKTEVDLAGNARIGGKAVDLGAYEYQLIRLARPVLTVANTTDTAITISWNAVPNALRYSFSYRLAGETTWTNKNVGENLEYTLDDLEPDTEYEFRLKAVGDDVNYKGIYSGVRHATTKIFSERFDVPANVCETEKTATTVTVAWDAVADAGGYRIAWRKSGDSADSYVKLGAAETSYQLADLDNDATYVWSVQALGDGVAHAASEYTSERTVRPRQTLETPILSVDDASPSLTITWNAVPNAERYSLSYKLANGTTWTSKNVGTVTSYTITGLAPNTEYDVCLKAIGDGMDYKSVYSAVLRAETDASPAPVVGPVRLDVPVLSVATTTDSTIAVTWGAIENAVRYSFSYKLASETTWKNVNVGTNLDYTVSGLEANADYDLRLKAIGDGVNYRSVYSSVVQAQTTSASSAVIDAHAELFDEFFDELDEEDYDLLAENFVA